MLQRGNQRVVLNTPKKKRFTFFHLLGEIIYLEVTNPDFFLLYHRSGGRGELSTRLTVILFSSRR